MLNAMMEHGYSKIMDLMKELDHMESLFRGIRSNIHGEIVVDGWNDGIDKF